MKMSSSIGEAGSFACYHCDKVFSFKYSRERHVICDHEDEDKSFERCLTKFSSMFDLKQYSKLCDKPLKCHKLKKHLKGHSCCQLGTFCSFLLLMDPNFLPVESFCFCQDV